MKIYKFVIVFIEIVFITIITGCLIYNKPNQLVNMMSDHKADYWFVEKDDISFCHAIEWADINKMKKLLKKGLNINSQGKYGMTFLIYSYLKSNKESYQFLLESGADPNIVIDPKEELKVRNHILGTKLSMITLAAWERSDSFYLEMALIHGGNPNTNINEIHVIYDALFSKNLENIKLLIEYGADANGPKDNLGDFLYQAISDTKYDIAYYLLEKGADPEIHKDKITHAINNQIIGSLDLKIQGEYKEKVIKILEGKGFKFKASQAQHITR